MSTGLNIAIPHSWSWSPLKFATTYLNRGTAPDYIDDGPIRAISQAANQASGLDWQRTRFHDYNGDPRRLKGYLLPGDVLVNSTGNGTLGRVGYFTEGPDGIPCVADGHVTVARANKPTADPRYMYYWLSSTPFQNYIYAALVVGATNQIELSRDRLAGAPIPVPHFEEQRRIADFLDAETARIDAILDARKAQLSTLDSKRRVQIRDAVSGATSNQETGQSIAWLGPINNAWPTALLGIISRTYMGTTFPHEHQGLPEGNFPFIKVGDFSAADADLALDGAANWLTREGAKKLRATIIPPQSILYARVGAAMLLNQRRIVLRECIVDDNVRAISFHHGNPRYWLYLLTCLDLGELANPGPVPSVSEGQVSAVRLPFPPIEEQERIVRKLDSEAANIEGLKDLIRRQLQSLAERRQALITAAVTGGITV